MEERTSVLNDLMFQFRRLDALQKARDVIVQNTNDKLAKRYHDAVQRMEEELLQKLIDMKETQD